VEAYTGAMPLIKQIFANELRERIIRALGEKAMFLDELVSFTESEKFEVYKELVELEKLNVIECRDEIYMLTDKLGKPSLGLLKLFDGFA